MCFEASDELDMLLDADEDATPSKRSSARSPAADPFGAGPFAPPPLAAPPPPPARANAPLPPPARQEKPTGAFARKEAAVPPPAPGSPRRDSVAPRPFATIVDDLGKELAAVLSTLEGGQWPHDSGLELSRLRDEAVQALAAAGLARVATRTNELLTVRISELLFALQSRKLAATDLAHTVRAVSEALAAQCRSELAPLLGSSGSPWEASI
jgi:hypothetical protein